MPKISFITGVKDRPEQLKEMMKTLIAQDMQDWEAIIVDDHSAENIEAVIKTMDDDRFHCYALPVGQTGISAARNFAVERAHSEIILIADADDLNEPNRGRITYEAMKKTNCDVFYGNIRFYAPGQKSRGSRFQPFSPELLKMINFIPNPAAAFRKRKFLEIGEYDPEFKISEDYELWTRFLLNGSKFCGSREVLVNYRHGDKRSLSKTKFYLLHQYISKVRIKNKLKVFNLEDTKKFAVPAIAQKILSKKGRALWQDDRFEGNQ